MSVFRDRSEAGRALARRLAKYADRFDVLVLGLPRGGVPVAYEVSRALNADLDVYVVRKLGLPGHEELAMGAIASGGIRVLNEDLVRELLIPPEVIDAAVARESVELARREKLYRRGRPPLTLRGRTVILTDDGLATGATMRAACLAARQNEPVAVVVAAPVAALEAVESLTEVADECVVVATPDPFHGVGLWYDDFRQTPDDEVCALLERAAGRPRAVFRYI